MKKPRKETTEPRVQGFEFWRSFAENDFLCFLVTNNQGLITFINPAGEKMYGYKAKELIGRHISVLYKGIKLLPSIAGLIRKNAKLAKPWEAEIWNIRRDGTEFPIWIATHYLHDENGRRVGALSISRDISRDVKARGQAQYLAGLSKQIDMALISTDNRGIITSINKAGELLFDYNSNDLIGKSIRVLYSKKNPLEKINKLKRQIDGGKGFIEQLYLRRRDGTEFLTWLSTSPLYNEEGNLIGFLGVGRDITEEAEAQEKVRYTAELVDRAHFCILSTDRDNIIRSINPAGEKLYGYKAGELIGKDRSTLYRDVKLTPEKMKILNGKMKKGEGWVTELENVRKNGEIFPVRLATAYLDDERGKRKGAVSIAQDITEERRLKRQAIESEKLISLGQAAAGIAHEINNPLNALLNIAHILSREKCLGEDEDKKWLIPDLNNEIYRLRQLTADFMQFARPRPLAKDRTDLNQILREVIRLFKLDRETASGITYVQKLQKAAWGPADPNQLKQVIINIVRNAVQALEGKGRVTISSFQTAQQVGFTIKDNGPGIPENVLKRIFEPFYSTKSRGSGLGMAICKQIVDQHRGTIRIESKVGSGTSVKITIPGKI